MPNRRFKEKVERYFAYDVSGRYKERHKGQRFRVLVVTKTLERIGNLKRTAAQVAQRYRWFTTLAELRVRGTMERIWEVIARDGKGQLFDQRKENP